jgi:opacity protein-like surface antigen
MKYTFLILLSVVSCSTFAQHDKKHWKSTPMLTTQSFGISMQKFDGLNSSIAAFPQYKALRENMGTLSVGSMNIKKNFITGTTLTGGSSMSGDRNKKSSTIRFVGGQINLGYDLIPGEKFMLYPLAGIGVEAYQAKFYKDNSAVSFNDVLNSSATQNSIKPVKFTNSFFTYNVGMGFTVKPAKHTGTIGIQASYTGSFKDKAWKSADMQELAGAPVDKLGRFQVGLIFTGKANFTK